MSKKDTIKGIDKNGNPYCVPVVRKTLADFVAEANEIWHGIYDYTDSVYRDKLSPITIYCPRHDLHFTVGMAQNHVIKPHGKGKATGCPVCSYEQQHGKQYGPEWRETLRLSPKQNRVGRIVQPQSHKTKTPEQIAAEKAEREAKAEAKRREEQAYIDHWKAKDFFEARFKERVFRMYGDQYDMSLVDYQGNDKEVTLICRHHGMFKIRPRHLLVGITQGNGTKKPSHGCWKCCGLQDPHEKHVMTADEFFERMHQLYDASELDFLTSEYKGMRENVTAYCHKHGAITHPAKYWLDGKGCEYCNGQFYPPDFPQLAHKAQGAEYSYRSVNKIKSASSRVMVHCGNPNHKWHRMLVSLVLQGCKCRECAGRHQPLDQRREHFRQRVIEKHGTKRFDIVWDEYVNNDTPISVHCNVHHYDYKTTPDNLLRKTGGCPFCTASEGEAVIKGWLDNHDIPHTWHAQVPNEDPTLPLQYVEPDFWLPDYNLYIEYHGVQHYEDIGYFFDGKRIRNFAVQQQRDRYLRDYCQRHGYRLLEIPYWDFKRIGEILADIFLQKE